MNGAEVKAAIWIDNEVLTRLSDVARASPRLRKNLNFHPDDAFVSHRLLNAIEPGSYIAPHRHLDPHKDETIIVLRGRLGVVLFDADGGIRESAALTAGGPCCGIDIPHGAFHSLVALDPGCVMFEAKAGPYQPLTVDERATWAPGEGDPGVAAYLEGLVRRFG